MTISDPNEPARTRPKGESWQMVFVDPTEVEALENEAVRLRARVEEPEHVLSERDKDVSPRLGLATTEGLFKELETRLKVGVVTNNGAYKDESMARALAVFRKRLPWFALGYRTVDDL